MSDRPIIVVVTVLAAAVLWTSGVLPAAVLVVASLYVREHMLRRQAILSLLKMGNLLERESERNIRIEESIEAALHPERFETETLH